MDAFVQVRVDVCSEHARFRSGIGNARDSRVTILCVNGSVTESPRRLKQRLLDYWVQHPELQGTIESIVEWWLLEQRIQQTTDEVRWVLAGLIAKDFVVEEQQADARIHYRLNRGKEVEIREWLRAARTAPQRS